MLGKIFCLSQDGDMYVVEAGSAFWVPGIRLARQPRSQPVALFERVADLELDPAGPYAGTATC